MASLEESNNTITSITQSLAKVYVSGYKARIHVGIHSSAASPAACFRKATLLLPAHVPEKLPLSNLPAAGTPPEAQSLTGSAKCIDLLQGSLDHSLAPCVGHNLACRPKQHAQRQ
jgi:hypothetical protein